MTCVWICKFDSKGCFQRLLTLLKLRFDSEIPGLFCGYFDAIFSISIYENVHIDSSSIYFYNSFIGNSKNKITTNIILD